MDIHVYGKKDCGLCEAAKEKFKRFGVLYRFHDLEVFEDWRDSGKVGAMAEYVLMDTLPIIRIDGEYVLYPTAMKMLKRWLKQRQKEKDEPTQFASGT